MVLVHVLPSGVCSGGGGVPGGLRAAGCGLLALRSPGSPRGGAHRCRSACARGRNPFLVGYTKNPVDVDLASSWRANSSRNYEPTKWVKDSRPG